MCSWSWIILYCITGRKTNTYTRVAKNVVFSLYTTPWAWWGKSYELYTSPRFFVRFVYKTNDFRWRERMQTRVQLFGLLLELQLFFQVIEWLEEIWSRFYAPRIGFFRALGGRWSYAATHEQQQQKTSEIHFIQPHLTRRCCSNFIQRWQQLPPPVRNFILRG